MPKRIFLYFIGFFIGSVLVYFLFFRNQSRSFLPSSIVLDSLKSKEITIEEKAECYLSCYNISKENIRVLLDDADVIFSESSPRENPKKYMVEIENSENKKLKLKFEMLQNESKIIAAEMQEVAGNCDCE